MEFKIVLTRQAQLDFRNITHYLLYELKSEQAAISVTNDMEHTIERLSYIAGGLKLCDAPISVTLDIVQYTSNVIIILCFTEYKIA